jgi:hypothetical protein
MFMQPEKGLFHYNRTKAHQKHMQNSNVDLGILPPLQKSTLSPFNDELEINIENLQTRYSLHKNSLSLFRIIYEAHRT